MFAHKHAQLGSKLETYNLHKRIGNQIHPRWSKYIRNKDGIRGGVIEKHSTPKPWTKSNSHCPSSYSVFYYFFSLCHPPSVCRNYWGSGIYIGEEPGLRGPKVQWKKTGRRWSSPDSMKSRTWRGPYLHKLCFQLPRLFRAVWGLRNSICYSETGGNQKEGKP